jgi:hypothetical protein
MSPEGARRKGGNCPSIFGVVGTSRDPGEGTPLSYGAPSVDLPEDWLAQLRTVLDTRDDIVAAYWVATTYLDAADATQNELHLELTHPPKPGTGGAPVELFIEVSRILPRTESGRTPGASTDSGKDSLGPAFGNDA